MDITNYLGSTREEDDECLIDSATSHTILKNVKYFSHLKMGKKSVKTISGSANLIEGSGRTNLCLPEGTQLVIENALFSSKSRRNLLSFKDIRRNGYHIETLLESDIEYLCITTFVSGRKQIVEKCPLSCGMYCTNICAIETNHIVNQKFTDPKSFVIWHNRLGHPGAIMMRRIIENSHGHPLKDQKILLPNEFNCVACSQGKLITRHSPMKVGFESPNFLERIHGDICGPISPACGPFRYFMVLIDASSRWSHVCLLSTRNVAFARLLAQIIKLRAQFPDHPIKKIRLDNAGEFSSQTFDDYCMSIGISVEHPVAHVHTQNGLAESLIKRLQLIARPLLMRTKLPLSAWGHAILHAATLIRLRPTNYHKYSPLQLAFGFQPNISHLRVFGCAVYVPVATSQRTKMGPQRRLGIYVGFESPSIIRYLEPMTGDVFTARFADCHFDESNFPTLGGVPDQLIKELAWKASSVDIFDPRTKHCDLEVQRIVHLQRIANQMPDAFNDSSRVTRSHIPAENVPIKLDIPRGQSTNAIANSSSARLKRGRPIGSKDKNPRKKRGVNDTNVQPDQLNIDSDKNHVLKEQEISGLKKPITTSPEEHTNSDSTNHEISINFVTTRKCWNRNETIVDNIFACNVALEINDETEDFEPKSVDECRKRDDWPKWKGAIQSELDSLTKREVFGPIIRTPEDVQPVGFKWIFVRKRNERNEIVRYKAMQNKC